jgi:hypothetical protein
MVDIDLMYCTYRQQELWHEAAAQALTCSGGPRGARTSARCLPWCRVSQPRYERTHVW